MRTNCGIYNDLYFRAGMYRYPTGLGYFVNGISVGKADPQKGKSEIAQASKAKVVAENIFSIYNRILLCNLY